MSLSSLWDDSEPAFDCGIDCDTEASSQLLIPSHATFAVPFPAAAMLCWSMLCVDWRAAEIASNALAVLIAAVLDSTTLFEFIMSSFVTEQLLLLLLLVVSCGSIKIILCLLC